MRGVVVVGAAVVGLAVGDVVGVVVTVVVVGLAPGYKASARVAWKYAANITPTNTPSPGRR
jgi:hypothetical protein